MNARIYTSIFTGIAALAFASSAISQEPAPPAANKGAVAAPAPKDTMNFCYFADQAYSEGAELHGAICQRRASFNVYESSEPANLKWVKAPKIHSIMPKLSEG